MTWIRVKMTRVNRIPVASNVFALLKLSQNVAAFRIAIVIAGVVVLVLVIVCLLQALLLVVMVCLLLVELVLVADGNEARFSLGVIATAVAVGLLPFA